MKLLRQSLFAKRDYKGLSEKGKQLLSKKRKEEARNLSLERRNLKKVLEDAEKEVSRGAEKRIKNSLVSDKNDIGKIIEERAQKIDSMRKNFFKNSYDKALNDSKNRSKRLREEALKVKDEIIPVISKKEDKLGKGLKKVISDKRILIPAAVITTGVGGAAIYSNYKKKKQIENSRKTILGG